MTVEQRSRLMSKIKSKGTKAELALRKALREEGLRYRLYYGPEKVDIAFPREKVAVFVDGCFWHSCPEHGHIPKSNVGYWGAKLSKNKERAAAKDARLRASGWAPVHIWEHEVYADPAACAKKVNGALESIDKKGRADTDIRRRG